MAKYIVTDTNLSSIADAIRTKGNTSESLAFPSGFITAIDNLSTGGKTMEGTAEIITRKIEEYENDKIKTIRDYAFYFYNNLTTISFPQVTTIGSDAFYNCTRLTTISFPQVTTIGSSAFYGCSSLTTMSFPQVTTISNSTFRYCSNLTTAIFPKVTTMANTIFAECPKLTSLYLLGSSVATLGGSIVFRSSPIGGYTTGNNGVYGSVFVPASLLSAYKSATNWASVSSRIVGLTDAEIQELIS